MKKTFMRGQRKHEDVSILVHVALAYDTVTVLQAVAGLDQRMELALKPKRGKGD